MKRKPGKSKDRSDKQPRPASSQTPCPDKLSPLSESSAPARPEVGRLAWLALLAALAAGALMWLFPWDFKPQAYVPHQPGQLTFSKDVAPIIFANCTPCHRPSQSAPFSLLTFQDVKKRAKDIADVTARRYMPPWLPEQGYGEFTHERRLSLDQLGILQQWISEGASEGQPSDLPPAPSWSSDWQLGQPDLVVTMPKPYTLAAEGKDVNRNFVVPVPIREGRYVSGIEFHPGNPKVVHHAFVKIERTGQARRLEEEDGGFPGLNPPGEVPACHFLGWQPGRQAEMGPTGWPWRLEPGDDLVLQMHLNPSGKPELLQASIGLYFTDQRPTNDCFKILLTSPAIDIPPGETNYAIEDSYALPVDVDVLGVLPHAHYLGREMQGWAKLPDGSLRWLLWIKRWDFNWQGDYRYARPVFLPKGSLLSMRFVYDNSTNNVHNPNHPPQLVTYGQKSRDEMAELWFSVLPRNREDRATLARDYEAKIARVLLASDEAALVRDPSDANAHTDLGMMLMGQNKYAEAEKHFHSAVQSHPDFALARYEYGVLLRHQGRLAEARAQFLDDLRLHPNDFKAHGNLGAIAVQQGDLATAKSEFEAALRLNPGDALSRKGLELIQQAEKSDGKPTPP